MSVDITTLALKVTSEGITSATTQLEALSKAAANVENKTSSLKGALGGLSSSQANSAANIEKLLQRMQKQADLMGANTAQTNSYNLSQAKASELHRAMGAMLGAEVDAYKRLSQAQAEAIRMNNELNRAQAAGKNLNIAGQRAEEYRKLSQAQAEAIRMNNAHDASLRRNGADEAARKQHMLNEAMRNGHDAARGLSGSMGALWLTYGNILPMLAGVAIGASLREAISGFTAVEYQMTMVKALTEDTTNSVKQLTHQMHEVSLALGISPEAAAKGLRALAQAGLSTKDALETLPVAFKLATVGELALETAALAMTGVMNAYGLSVKGLEHIGDVMSKAGAMSAASVDSISVSMKYAAGTAEQYGVELEKLGAVLTLLGKRGITGSSAGVAANNLIAEVYSPSSEKAIKAQAALGVKAYVNGVRQSLDESIDSIKQGLSKFDAQSQGKLLEDMFGKKGGKGYYAIAKATKEEFQALEQELVESTGFTADVYKKSLETVQGQMNLTKAAITGMFAQVGEESAAPIKVLLGAIKDLAGSNIVKDAFVGLSQSIKTFITYVVPAAAVAGTLWMALRAGPPIIAAVTYAMTLFSAAGFATAYASVTTAVTGLITAFKAGSIAMLAANPIVAGLVGVVTLLAGAYFLLKRNQESSLDLHKTEMKNSEETQKALEDEIKLIDRKIGLQRKGYADEAMMGKIKELDNADKLTAMQEEVQANEKRIQSLSGTPQRSDGAELARMTQIDGLTKANEELKKALEVKKVMFDREAKLNEIRMQKLKEYGNEQAIQQYSRQLAEEGQVESKTGEKVYGKDDKGAKATEADALQAALKTIQNQVKLAKIEADQAKKGAQTEYNKGLIGEIDLIEKVRVAEVNKQATFAEIAAAKIKKLQGVANQETAIAAARGEMEAAMEATNAANAAAVNSRAELEVSTNKQALQFEVEKFKAQGAFRKAYDAEFKKDNAVKLGQLQSNIDKEKDAVKRGEFEKLKVFMEAAQAAGQVKANNLDAVNSFNVAAEATRNSLKGIQTATEGQGLAAMFDAATAASEAYAASLPDLEKKMSKITDPKALNEAQAELTRLAETQRKMWAGVAESISTSLSNAFGEAGKAAGDLMQVIMKAGQTQQMLSDQKRDSIEKATSAGKAFGFSEYDIAKRNGQINLEFAAKERSARVKAYGDAAGAAKSFFKEGSTGYKVLETAEKAFRLIELAGMIKSLVMTQGIAAAKALAWVPAVMMSFMASMGPWGMAAAGVAIAAVLGGAFGGSSGGAAPMSSADRQKQAGTGSVLGDSDAKSESIANSLEIMEKNSGLGLVHSGNMVKSLNIIANSLGNLSSLVVRTAGIKDGVVSGVTEGTTRTALGNPILGGPLAMVLDKIPVFSALLTKLFGATTSIKDQGIKIGSNSLAGIDSVGVTAQSYADIETKKKALGITYSTKNSTKYGDLPQDVSDQFTLVIKSLADSVTAAASTLGLGGDAFTAKLKTFVVNISEISLKGMSADEIQKQFETVFSKLGDDMAKFAIDGLVDFSKIGEGPFETLARLASQLIQVKDVFAVLGKQFDATGMEAVKISDDLVKSAGSLEKLTEGTKYFVDNFLSEADRMKPITDSVTARLKELGMSELTSVELYAAKVKALNLTNTAEQELYTDLLALGPAFKQSADYATKLAEGTVELTKAQQKALDIASKQRELDIRLLEARGDVIGALGSRRNDELAILTKLNPALAETQRVLYGVEDAVANINKRAALEARVMEASGDTAGSLARKRLEEVNAMKKVNPELVELLQSIYKIEDASSKSAKQASLEARMMEAIGDVAGSLAVKRSEELAAMKKTNPELVGYLNALYGIEDATKAATTALNAEKEAKDRLSKYSSTRNDLDARMAEAVGNSVQATAIKRKAELAAMEELSPALADYLKRIYEAEDANVKATDNAEKLTSAKDALNDAYERESSALQSVIEKFKSFSDSLKEFKRGLLGGDLSTLSPEQKYLQSKANFAATAAKAAGGDESAMGQLQGMSQDFLEASRGYYASTEAYVKDFDAVQTALDRTINMADQQVSAAQAQLSIMQAQASSLVQIKDGVLSFADALKAYTKASEEAALTPVTTAKDAPTVPTGDSNYIGWHENVYKPAVKAAVAKQDNEELTKLTRELLVVMQSVSESSSASVAQNAAIAEENAKKQKTLTDAIDKLQRKMAAA